MGKTGPACRVCEHEHRHLIELGLVHRVPVRVLARRFELSKDSVFRHRRMHMSPTMVAAMLAAARPSEIDLEELKKTEGEALLGSLVAQRARLQMLSEMAFAEGEVHAATSVERAITNSLELTSKLLGVLVTTRQVTTNVLISGDYLQVRAAIMAALRSHPDAARDVARALYDLEATAAAEIDQSRNASMLEAAPC
jgi:hypothetical protein